MPHSAPRACHVPGCQHTVTPTSPCPIHPSTQPWKHEVASSTARGYGADWQRKRAAKLRSEPLCRPCKQAGRVTAAVEVDHVIAKAKGGTDESRSIALQLTDMSLEGDKGKP